MFQTIGIDAGTSAIKVALVDYPQEGEKASPQVRSLYLERIRKRNPEKVVEECFQQVLEETGLAEKEIAYVASTGEGDVVPHKTGHFYGMTTHARGAQFLCPGTQSVLDIGALHVRAIRINERARVLQYKMTGQCASGSGQFLENIARYLGVGMDEIGPLSQQSKSPHMVSSICAVLAETDVINMVSQGIPTSDILRGIHESISTRLINLLRSIHASAPLTLTGGLAHDVGLVEVLRHRLEKEDTPMEVRSHAHSVFAGAIGAALWAGFRHLKLTSPRKSIV